MSEAEPLLVVGYRRVSTDKQETDRQIGSCTAWASREKARIAEWFEDMDVSGKIDPFERDGFLAACGRAQEIGAKGIIVETADRFTRRGTRHYFVYSFRLEEKFGLKLYEADQSVQQQESGLGEIMSAMKAMAAKDWLDTHSRRMKEVAAAKKARGERMGQPPKTFDLREQQFVLDSRRSVPKLSWDAIANELSKRRGAFDVTDKAARYRRMVSEGHVRRFHARLMAVMSVSSPDSESSLKLKEEQS